MHLVYIDDSKDEKNIVFSALCIPADQWAASLDHLIGMRRAMRKADGIYTSVELHATDWLGGRGNVADFTVPKGARQRLFDYVLSAVAMMPGVQLIHGMGPKRDEMRLFERLLNRVQTNMQRSGSRAVVISDQGKDYDPLLRRLRRHNPIPSAFGDWGDGVGTRRNLPLDRLLEDIVYRDSKRSYFIQAADFCAYALLRFEAPTSRSLKFGTDKSLRILERIIVKSAYGKDPKRLGIVRTT